jgi:hypothetical protein
MSFAARTDHNICLQEILPHWKPALLLIVLQQRRDHAAYALGRKKDLEGPLGAECVPDRPSCVALAVMHLVGVARVVAAAFGSLGRVLKGVPKGGCGPRMITRQIYRKTSGPATGRTVKDALPLAPFTFSIVAAEADTIEFLAPGGSAGRGRLLERRPSGISASRLRLAWSMLMKEVPTRTTTSRVPVGKVAQPAISRPLVRCV